MSDKRKHPGTAKPPSRTLTCRETEVVRCLLDGRSNIAIGQTLGCSGETVKRHLWNICNKTGMGSRLELALYAERHPARVGIFDD